MIKVTRLFWRPLKKSLFDAKKGIAPQEN